MTLTDKTVVGILLSIMPFFIMKRQLTGIKSPDKKLVSICAPRVLNVTKEFTLPPGSSLMSLMTSLKLYNLRLIIKGVTMVMLMFQEVVVEVAH
jgi:hypothetical protein